MNKEYTGIDFRADPAKWYGLLNGYGYKCLSDYDFSKCIMPTFTNKISFHKCNLRGTSFEKSRNFQNSGFNDCDMTDSNLNDAEIDQGHIEDCDCTNMSFENGSLNRRTLLTNNIFMGTNFRKSHLSHVTFTDNIFTNAIFDECIFYYLIFNDNHDFTNCSFKGEKGREIMIHSKKTAWEMRKCNFDKTKNRIRKRSLVG
jgi:uncharacterized protein YjbI with pentapeptide repeats